MASEDVSSTKGSNQAGIAPVRCILALSAKADGLAKRFLTGRDPPLPSASYREVLALATLT